MDTRKVIITAGLLALLVVTGCASADMGGRGPQVYATPAEFGGAVGTAAAVAASEAGAGLEAEAAADAGVDAALDAYEAGEFQTQIPPGVAGALPWWAQAGLGLLGFVADAPVEVGGSLAAALYLLRKQSRQGAAKAVRAVNVADGTGRAEMGEFWSGLAQVALPGWAFDPETPVGAEVRGKPAPEAGPQAPQPDGLS